MYPRWLIIPDICRCTVILKHLYLTKKDRRALWKKTKWSSGAEQRKLKGNLDPHRSTEVQRATNTQLEQKPMQPHLIQTHCAPGDAHTDIRLMQNNSLLRPPLEIIYSPHRHPWGRLGVKQLHWIQSPICPKSWKQPWLPMTKASLKTRAKQPPNPTLWCCLTVLCSSPSLTLCRDFSSINTSCERHIQDAELQEPFPGRMSWKSSSRLKEYQQGQKQTPRLREHKETNSAITLCIKIIFFIFRKIKSQQGKEAYYGPPAATAFHGVLSPNRLFILHRPSILTLCKWSNYFFIPQTDYIQTELMHTYIL